MGDTTKTHKVILKKKEPKNKPKNKTKTKKQNASKYTTQIPEETGSIINIKTKLNSPWRYHR